MREEGGNQDPKSQVQVNSKYSLKGKRNGTVTRNTLRPVVLQINPNTATSDFTV
jgi:hypothetical protein